MTKRVQDSLTSKDGRLNEQSTTIPSEKGNGPASRPGSAKFPSSVEMGPKKFGEWVEQQILKNLKNPARHYPEEGQEPERVHSQRQLGLEAPAMTMAGSESARLLAAVSFAAKKHRDQRRKDVDASPYINHPLAVAETLTNVGDVTDLNVLIAALLHDTLEDTETTPEELEVFGPAVRKLVMDVTDDKETPKEERKQQQIEHAPELSHEAKIIKLGDKIYNVRDVIVNPPTRWSVDRRREYLSWAGQVVAGCRGSNPALEAHFDELLFQGQAALAADSRLPIRIDSLDQG